MKISIRNQKDVGAGLLYIGFGAAFSLGALNYTLGEPARMGPGWFPFWIGILLVVVGVFTVASGLKATAAIENVKRLQLGSLAWIIGAVVLFGLLLKPLGLVGSLALLVLVSSRASHEFTWKSSAVLAVALILFSSAVFIWGISLQLDLWPSFLD
jgi:Tripartite tricarboxylate transporter TctB family